MTLSEEFGLLPVFKLPTEVGCEFNRKVIQLEYDGVKSADKIIRILFRATALLFAELCREIL